MNPMWWYVGILSAVFLGGGMWYALYRRSFNILIISIALGFAVSNFLILMGQATNTHRLKKLEKQVAAKPDITVGKVGLTRNQFMTLTMAVKVLTEAEEGINPERNPEFRRRVLTAVMRDAELKGLIDEMYAEMRRQADEKRKRKES